MPYKPVNLGGYVIDAKLKPILEFAQEEYKKIIGVPVEDIVVDKKSKGKKKRKMSEKVLDFLFEPKYDNALKVFPKKSKN
ncbi:MULTISPECIES: hypothetical protein [Tenacibaculum]|uniref:Uncharacterized protein n=1 Tax=Tenacibaculum soleae TaxID=447689 RepID=A0A1B9Y2D6_9FLAO|nr:MULTISPECIES: hypothetical protein [Tenacibaculum]MDO6744347.1 hypothetical protein [Tenacibaculum soleae]MDO6812748.1 hypothetical protein [Tenacibaculum soleae]OCK43861.1 hypothetical protein BA195_03960 [Tenacibaculum soleae]